MSIKKKICALVSAVMMTSFVSAMNASAAVSSGTTAELCVADYDSRCSRISNDG